MLEKLPEKRFPDRPLECTECKKSIAVRYTEVVGESITHTSMCSDCPELLRKLHGTNPSELIANQTGIPAGLECGNCGTRMEDIRRGHLLGCQECYNVFENLLIIEMQATNCIPPRLLPLKKNLPLHLGRSPGEQVVMGPSSRLLALNEALQDTLNREDYEQAAWLRDQIRALTEESEFKNPPDEKKNEQGK